MTRSLKLVFSIMCVLLLIGCSKEVKDKFGLYKNIPPDEFLIETHKPLTIPSTMDLPNPIDEDQNNEEEIDPSELSDTEKKLLEKSGAPDADNDIKKKLKNEKHKKKGKFHFESIF